MTRISSKAAKSPKSPPKSPEKPTQKGKKKAKAHQIASKAINQSSLASSSKVIKAEQSKLTAKESKLFNVYAQVFKDLSLKAKSLGILAKARVLASAISSGLSLSSYTDAWGDLLQAENGDRQEDLPIEGSTVEKQKQEAWKNAKGKSKVEAQKSFIKQYETVCSSDDSRKGAIAICQAIGLDLEQTEEKYKKQFKV